MKRRCIWSSTWIILSIILLWWSRCLGTCPICSSEFQKKSDSEGGAKYYVLTGHKLVEGCSWYIYTVYINMYIYIYKEYRYLYIYIHVFTLFLHVYVQVRHRYTLFGIWYTMIYIDVVRVIHISTAFDEILQQFLLFSSQCAWRGRFQITHGVSGTSFTGCSSDAEIGHTYMFMSNELPSRERIHIPQENHRLKSAKGEGM